MTSFIYSSIFSLLIHIGTIAMVFCAVSQAVQLELPSSSQPIRIQLLSFSVQQSVRKEVKVEISQKKERIQEVSNQSITKTNLPKKNKILSNNFIKELMVQSDTPSCAAHLWTETLIENANLVYAKPLAIDISSGQTGDEVKPKCVQNQPPHYPRQALLKGLEGETWLSLEVDENGEPHKIHIQKTSGCEMLDRSAVNAVQKWQFAPAKRLGIPVKSECVVPVRFQIV